LNDLGSFSVPFIGWESYTFVPLRDTNGNLVSLTFNGSTNTLRLTRPSPTPTLQDVNVNFLMLVPEFQLTVSYQAPNVVISFPTQSGFKYQLQYKTNLSDPSWTALGGPIAGDNTVKSVNDPIAGRRFYRAVVQ